MTGVRGGDKSPGEFRTSQNWIGGSGSTLRDASFIPPPPHELMAALGQLEVFLHSARSQVPLLVRCALAHAQFETIHPFLDGNGRVGRLLITLMLCEEGALSRPLLYLSLRRPPQHGSQIRQGPGAAGPPAAPAHRVHQAQQSPQLLRLRLRLRYHCPQGPAPRRTSTPMPKP